MSWKAGMKCKPQGGQAWRAVENPATPGKLQWVHVSGPNREFSPTNPEPDMKDPATWYLWPSTIT